MKIGFFGDSFCEEISNPHSFLHGYETYISLLKKHYDAEIVNLGHGGCSVWDVILNQFSLFEKDLPDVTIFVWTDVSRLYHKTVRNLTYSSVNERKLLKTSVEELLNPKVIKSAKLYFDHLYNSEKSELEYKSLLYYFDNEVLSRIIDKTKIIHCWSFEKKYNWKNGIELSIPLITFADQSMAANHINGNRNLEVFNLIKNLID